MVLLPILVHLIPFSGAAPLGAYLLPMFVASSLAVYYLSPAGLVLSAMLAPVLNHFLTGMPTMAVLPGLIAELALFSLITWWLVHKRPEMVGISDLAVVSAKLLVWASGLLLGSGVAFGLFLSGILTAVPGLLALLAVELLLRRRNG
jgi:niacin transporter